jgi:MFS transporter, OPA family, glycerol-3-phosphate transporter
LTARLSSAFHGALNSASPSAARTDTASRERLALWVLWLTYGSFYFCRNNLGVAVPGISAEFGFTKAQLGTVLMALKLAYGAGQFINGQLAERFPPRRLLALGLLASAALNVLFGWATALFFMTFIWACNGYVQALGWAPCVRVTSNWFPTSRRGRAMGIIGTGYQLCGALTFVVAGWAADRFGWRGALFIPSALLAASALHMWLLLEEAPGANAAPAIQNPEGKIPKPASVGQNLAVTLTNPWLWFVALTLGLLDSCRYGYTDWGVTHLTEIQKASVSSAAFKYAVLPFGGIAGAYLAGWATDRWFGGRRVPVIATLLGVLALITFAYDTLIGWGLTTSIVTLFLVGFCIFGPQVLLVGTLPADLAKRDTAAAAAGFVNFMGYMGAAAGNKLTGELAQNQGWPVAVRFWAGCALAGALIIACLWQVERRRNNSSLRLSN